MQTGSGKTFTMFGADAVSGGCVTHIHEERSARVYLLMLTRSNCRVLCMYVCMYVCIPINTVCAYACYMYMYYLHVHVYVHSSIQHIHQSYIHA